MFDRSSTFGDALDDAGARAVLETFLPGVAASPMAGQFRDARLGQLVAISPALREDAAEQERFWASLADVAGGRTAQREYAPAIEPDPKYESDDVSRGSAAVTVPAGAVPRWGVVEVRFEGPSHGNPFVEVELGAIVTNGERSFEIGGFYDGDGVYLIRFLAEAEGEWRFETASTASSFDGISGAVQVGPAASGTHGPVRADGLHFAHADGTRYRPVGTTAYAWTHQPEEVQLRTLAALADTSFNKLRMCLFPKSYLYNANEPERFPFPGSLADGFDLERFDVEYFRALERRIADLAALGIEADLILFHAYDRWGFADLGPAVDERLVRYVVRRLAASANMWWALANEYDLVWAKTTDDWERIAAVIGEEDPHQHLRSIHNCHAFYDQSRPWITHVSAQRVDVYRTAENTDEWRKRWGKPVVIDEIGYEGDIDQGWGNLTGEELVRRAWEGAVRGGYVGHGETYLNEREELWWSKGGELTGSSPSRLGFLDRIIGEAPGGVLDPLPSDWDVPWGGVAGDELIAYFGFNRPSFRNLVLPEGDFELDVIDTWNMTVERMPGVHRGAVRVELPARQFMAVRLRRVGPHAVE
ncbi:DUF5605 domain-containing protein [Streptomyces sp. ISL-90]|nr:DUF5605 domain-containing protein [Streptomyces sp. ISL-90]